MKIKIESHERYGKCRVGEGWAVALDVARILGYVKGTTFANKHVAKEDKRYEPVRALNSTNVAKTMLINKTGVEAMTAASANVEADGIKAWILSVMDLPQVAEKTPADNLQIVEVEGVRGYIAPNGVAWLNVEHVARGLGFVEVMKDRVGAADFCGNYPTAIPTAIRWRTINAILAEFDYPPVHSGDFIPENIFYLLAMKANNKTAKEFQLKVANKILPSIRQHGFYSVKPLEPPAIAAVDFTALVERMNNLELLVQTLIDSLAQAKDSSDKQLGKADRAKELLAIAREMDACPDRQKLLLHAANLINGKKIF